MGVFLARLYENADFYQGGLCRVRENLQDSPVIAAAEFGKQSLGNELSSGDW